MRCALLAIALTCLATGCVAPPEPEPDHAAPLVVGVLGHSLMAGYNADAAHPGSHKEISWGTGNDSWSFASMLNATGRENVAAPGAPSTAFAPQVAQLTNTTLAVVGFIDGDVCAGIGVLTGTPPGRGTFEKDLRDGLAALRAKNVTPFLVTMPDLASMASAARGKPPPSDNAAFWGALEQCGNDPQYPAKNAAMNAAIVKAAKDAGAMSDGGALAKLAWTPVMISEYDGFHPSIPGLQKMAEVEVAAYRAAGS